MRPAISQVLAIVGFTILMRSPLRALDYFRNGRDAALCAALAPDAG